jgi:hypothetical protein
MSRRRLKSLTLREVIELRLRRLAGESTALLAHEFQLTEDHVRRATDGFNSLDPTHVIPTITWLVGEVDRLQDQGRDGDRLTAEVIRVLTIAYQLQGALKHLADRLAADRKQHSRACGYY